MRALLRECIAEMLGTWLMVFLGTATVAAAVTTGAQSGLWQVAVVWGFAVTLAIYLTAHISGAHLNPAVTISLACTLRRARRTRFPAHKVLPYIIAQLLGAIGSGACVLALYGSAIVRYELRNGITRGVSANSTLSAMIFGEYFPNPQLVHTGVLDASDVSPLGALGVEALGTMVLMLLIRALTDDANAARPSAQHAPFYIGFTVASLISVLAPLSQAGFNPARDFGPRIVAALAGWSSVAIPGPQSGCYVYVLGPVLGALAGGWLYDLVLFPAYVATTAETAAMAGDVTNGVAYCCAPEGNDTTMTNDNSSKPQLCVLVRSDRPYETPAVRHSDLERFGMRTRSNGQRRAAASPSDAAASSSASLSVSPQQQQQQHGRSSEAARAYYILPDCA